MNVYTPFRIFISVSSCNFHIPREHGGNENGWLFQIINTTIDHRDTSLLCSTDFINIIWVNNNYLVIRYSVCFLNIDDHRSHQTSCFFTHLHNIVLCMRYKKKRKIINNIRLYLECHPCGLNVCIEYNMRCFVCFGIILYSLNFGLFSLRDRHW